MRLARLSGTHGASSLTGGGSLSVVASRMAIMFLPWKGIVRVVSR
jgi:hypothetical protein